MMNITELNNLFNKKIEHLTTIQEKIEQLTSVNKRMDILKGDQDNFLEYKFNCDRKDCESPVLLMYNREGKNNFETWCLPHFMEMMKLENAYDWEHFAFEVNNMIQQFNTDYKNLLQIVKSFEKIFVKKMEYNVETIKQALAKNEKTINERLAKNEKIIKEKVSKTESNVINLCESMTTIKKTLKTIQDQTKKPLQKKESKNEESESK